jgi:hypothetical protein
MEGPLQFLEKGWSIKTVLSVRTKQTAHGSEIPPSTWPLEGSSQFGKKHQEESQQQSWCCEDSTHQTVGVQLWSLSGLQ